MQVWMNAALALGEGRGAGARAGWVLALWSVAGLATSAWAQAAGEVVRAEGEAAAAEPAAADPAAADPGAAVAPGAGEIRFAFSEAPFSQVIDVFSRQTGLPVIREAQPPAGAMTFISAESYGLSEALEILNLNLSAHGVRLVREANFLYLRSLAEAARKPTRVSGDGSLEGYDPTEYVTLTLPLSNSVAERVAEQIKPLVKEPGAVMALAAQNMIVLVETAAQCKRLREVVGAIDAVRPVDSEYRIFTLQHAEPGAVVEALKGLVGQRVVREIIEKNGEVRQVEQFDVAGLNIQPDERTRSVIAVGSATRLETVEELVALLDQPGGAGGLGSARLATFRLETVGAGEAARQVEALFRGLPEDRRPRVVALEAAGKVTVVGAPELVTQAAALIGAMDPLAAGEGFREAETSARVLPLRHLTTAQAEQVAGRLLSARQAKQLRWTAAGEGLIVAGPAADVDAFERVLSAVDRPSAERREVRRVSLVGGGDGARVLARANELDALTRREGDAEVEVLAGAGGDSGEVTLLGTARALDRFDVALRRAMEELAPERARKTYAVRHRGAGEVAAGLREAAKGLLGDGGAGAVGPTVEALESLRAVVVEATADEHAVLERALAGLDVPREGAVTRSVDLGRREPGRLLERALGVDAEQAARSAPGTYGAVSATVEAGSGRGILTGAAGDVARLESIIAALREAEGPARESRVLPLRSARAGDVVERLSKMLAEGDAAEAGAGGRAVEPARVAVAEGPGNAVRVTGEAGQVARAAEALVLLDRASVESRTFTPKVKKPSEIGPALLRLSEPMLRPADGGPYSAPEVEALDELGTLVVRAEPGQFGVLAALVEQLDAVRPGDVRVRVIPVRGPGAAGAVERARGLFAEQAGGAGGDGARAGGVTAEYDAASGHVVVRGRAEGVDLFATLLAESLRLLPPERTTRVVELRLAPAARVAGSLSSMLERAAGVEGEGVAGPEVSVVEGANALLVTGTEEQQRVVESFVQRLDTAEAVELPPLRLLQLRTADAGAVAAALQEQYDQRPASERAEKPVRVRAEASTGTLIVSAPAEYAGEIEKFVSSLNEQRPEAEGRETFVFPLKTARAADVALAMSALYPAPAAPVDFRGRAMPWLTPAREVSVTADASSNSLLIDAPAERRASLERLAATLDEVRAPAESLLRTYRVERADPVAVATMLRGLAARGTLSGPAKAGEPAAEVVIEAEPVSGTLIVAGDEAVFAKVEAVLKDLTAVPVERRLRVVPIQNAEASAVRDRAVLIYEAQTAGVPGAGPVEVTVDEGTNSLEVVADEEAMSRFVLVLEELQRQAGPAREVRLIELRLARAADVAAFLRELAAASDTLEAAGSGGPAPVFEPVASGNSLLVAAQPGQLAIVEELVRQLDNAESAERPPLRILRLRTTDASGIASVLQQSFDRRGPEERALKPVGIEADVATNTLIVSAHPEMLPEIEAIVSDLNSQRATDAEGREIRIFPLRVARAEELARTIDEMYPEPPVPVDSRGRPLSQLAGRKEVVVRADAATNSLIVDAPGNRLAGFEQIVRSLDTLAVRGETELRTYRLVRADVNAVAETVRRLSESGGLGASGQVPVTVSVEPVSRTLVVSGPAEIFERVSAVVAETDGVGDRPATVLRLHPLRHARAERMAPLMRQLLSTRLREGAAGLSEAEAASLLEVASDAATNTLILSAPEDVQREAESLLEALDTEGSAAGRSTVRIVPMTFAEAGEVAASLREAMPALDLPGGGPVNVIAAGASNALLLTGAEGDVTKVAALIEPLDRRPFDPEEASIETFSLRHAEAGAIAQTVQRLLVDQRQDDPRLLAYQLRYLRGQLPSGPTIRVEAEPRTNSLVVSGPGETVRLAKSVIERLDRPAEDAGVEVLAFSPRRGEAGRLAEAVGAVLRKSLPQGRRGLELTADAASNTVLVVGEAGQAAEAVRVLGEFDDRTPALPMAEVRTFEMANAEAGTAAGVLRSALNDRSRWPAGLRAVASAGLSVPTVEVQAEASTNRVLVSGPGELMALASEMVRALDAPRTGGTVEVRVVRLTKGDAESVASVLNESLAAGLPAGAARPSVRPEPASNSVVIAASPVVQERAAALIASMDSAAAEPAKIGVRTLVLRHARAEALAPVVQRVLEGDRPAEFSSRYWAQMELRRERLRRGDAVEEDVAVRVEAERRLNALVVSASPGVLELAEQVVTGLDRPPEGDGPGGGRVVRVLTLRSADAGSVAESLSAVLENDPLAAEAPPTVRVDVSSNALIVGGTAEQVALVQRLAGDLDAAAIAGPRELRTIPIDRSRAKAGDVAEALRRLLRQSGGVRVEVISAEELLRREERGGEGEAGEGGGGADEAGGGGVQGMGGGADEGRPWMLRALAWWAAGAVAQVGAAGEEGGEDVGDAIEEDAGAVTIAVDPETNSLVVVGSPKAAERVATLARQVAEQLPSEPATVRVIELPAGVDVERLAGLARETFSQVGRAGRDNAGGLSGRVNITADVDAHALVVWANDRDFEAVADLVGGLARLDRSRELTVKVYRLENADAASALRAVRDLLSPNPTGRQARRVRELKLTLVDERGRERVATLDPAEVSATADAAGTSLIVAAPADSIAVIDRFVSLIDQTPAENRTSIRRYALENATAEEAAGSVQRLVDARRGGEAGRLEARPQIVADARTNSLLVTASDRQHAEVLKAVQAADVPVESPEEPVETIRLSHAKPSDAAAAVRDVLVGRDRARGERIRLSPQDDAGTLLVKASREDVAEIRLLLAGIDVPPAGSYPVRSIKLQRANAKTVADELQRFFEQRARVSGDRAGGRAGDAAIIGEARSGTIVIAASDEDYRQIADLAAQFDAPSAESELVYKIIQLKNARASDIRDTVQSVAYELQWERLWGQNQANAIDAKLIVETNERTNTVLVFGQGAVIETVERVIAELDVAIADNAEVVIEAVRLQRGDLRAVARLVEESTATPGWYEWRGRDPGQVQVEVDTERRLLLLVGAKARVATAKGYIEGIAKAGLEEGRKVQTIALRYADAERAAASLTRFFEGRARASETRRDAVAVIGSREGNLLLVSAPPEDEPLLADLVAQIDRPELGDDRRVEVYRLGSADVREVAQTLRSVFPDGGKAEDRVIVTPQPSTGTLIVSAPEAELERVGALLSELDRVEAEGAGSVVSVSLKNARAGEVAAALRSALPTGVRVQVTAVERSNTLLMTGSPEAVAVAMKQIEALDAEVAQSPVEFRRFELSHAQPTDVSFTLRAMLRARPRPAGDPQPSVDPALSGNVLSVTAAAEEMRFIEEMIRQLDVATGGTRKTEFVTLRHANAEPTAEALAQFYGRYAREAASPAARDVTILADPTTDSLIITGEAGVFDGIRALLEKLDTPEFDTSRQLIVIPLRHADAAGVARALSDGFRAPIEQQLSRERAQRDRDQRGSRGDNEGSGGDRAVLVSAEEVPSVSAEAGSNSLIIFAAKDDVERIKALVSALDVPEFGGAGVPRLIAVRGTLRASVAAARVAEVFRASPRDGRRTLVTGDDASGVLIVRADDEEYGRISAFVAELLEEAGRAGPTPVALRLVNVPAARAKRTVLAVFTPLAAARGETVGIEADAASNTLIVVAGPELSALVRGLVSELDGVDHTGAAGADAGEAGPAAEGAGDGAGGGGGDAAADDDAVAAGDGDVAPAAPAFGRTVGVVDVTHSTPEAMAALLTGLGLTREQPEERPGLVSEPVQVALVPSRRAVAVTGLPRDVERVSALVRSLDAPGDASGMQRLLVVPLRQAEARTLVPLLESMLRPTAGDGKTGPAAAVAEHVRRLRLTPLRVGEPAPELDLSTPIRLIADTQTNAVVVAASAGNAEVLASLIESFDALPIGEAVVARIMPLENAAASRVAEIVRELFSRGEAIARLPGTQRQAEPTTTTGRALTGDVVFSVDERTNALVIAGSEESVALVEVLVKDLDRADGERGWLETDVVALRHADAREMAETLRLALVSGLGQTPDAVALRRQVGRVRAVIRGGEEGAEPQRVTSDLYAPLSGLVIQAQEALNAVLVVGTRSNIEVVRAIASQLDVEKASAANRVRLIPLEHASAERVASTLRGVFEERARIDSSRPEDRLVVSVDTRTNALIVSTSPRSFEVLESLLPTLDQEDARFAVGLHVIATPGANAADLAPKIRRLMSERLAAERRRGGVEGPQDVFSVEADATSNLLIVAASDENLGLVRDLIAALTVDGEAAVRADVVELVSLTSSGRAAEIAQSVDELYTARENERRGPNSVRVIASERQNALIVSGTAEDVLKVRELVARLDVPEAEAVQEVKRIPLRAANAFEIVQLVQDLLAGRAIGGGRDQAAARQATRLRFYRDQIEAGAYEGVTEATIDAAVRELVRVTPDLRTNSVLVSAPPAILRLITDIVTDLDGETSGDRQIAQFRLVNADAQQMALLLRDLFNLELQGDTLVLVPRLRPEAAGSEGVEGAGAGAGLGDASVTPVPDQRQALAITVDRRTNTLLVSGTAEYLEQVREVVNQLDEIEANEREQFVYELRNARAAEVQATLSDYFSGEAELRRSLLGPQLSGSLARQLEQEVTIVGDEKSNKVLVSASPRYVDTVRRIIAELDAAPPQVMIQLLLAEVTLDDELTWGIDVNIGLDTLTSNIGGDGYTFSSVAGGAGVATAVGVPNFSVASEDFGLLIRALEAQGKLEVLSRPQVTVNNNEEARIQVGEDVGIVVGADRIGERVTAEVERRDVGIILQVTPSISSDGFVRMDISPEISSVSARTTQISEDVETPIITQRQVDTTVTVRDGQTVVIGGLIQTRGEERNTKVPLLGDLPLLGGIFRTTDRTSTKTELLVLLTPRVIPGDSPGSELVQDALREGSLRLLADPLIVRDALDKTPGREPGATGTDGAPAGGADGTAGGSSEAPAAEPPRLMPEAMRPAPAAPRPRPAPGAVRP